MHRFIVINKQEKIYGFGLTAVPFMMGTDGNRLISENELLSIDGFPMKSYFLI